MICKKHGELTEDQVKDSVSRGKRYKKCRACERERNKVYNEKNRDKRLAYERKRWAEKKDIIKEQRKSHNRIIRKYEYPERCKATQDKYRAELHDSYIKKLIKNDDKNISVNDIPIELIDLKRSVIQLKRTVKMMTLCQEKTKNQPTD